MAFISKSSRVNSPVNDVVVPAPPNLGPGNRLLAWAYNCNGLPATLTPPPGWTLVASVDDAGVDAINVMWLYTKVVGDEPSETTWTFSSTYGGVQIFQYAPCTIDTFQTDSADNTTAFATTPFTAAGAGETIVIGVGEYDGSQLGVPATTTQRNATTAHYQLGVYGYDVVAGSTAIPSFTATFDTPSPVDWLAITVALVTTAAPVLPLSISAPTVEIAFNPTDITELAQDWTDVTSYVRDFDTKSGKQHFLDRVEAGTLQMTLNANDGFFYNGVKNYSTKVIRARIPVRVTGSWLGVTYQVFRGLIDSAAPSITDQLKWDIKVTASDFLKLLANTKMASSTFWESFAQSQSAANWYRCDVGNGRTCSVTAANGTGSTITYTALNEFSAGDNVTINGLGSSSGKSLNLANQVIATATDKKFTVTSSVVGTSQGVGTAYRTIVPDDVGSDNGYYIGHVAFPQYGAMIYNANGSVDVCNGGSTPTGYVRLPVYGAMQGAIDFWMLGQGLGGTDPFECEVNISGTPWPAFLQVTPDGLLAFSVLGVGSPVISTVKVDDGFWHHVGLVSSAGGNLTLYADGQLFSLGAIGAMAGFKSLGGLNLAVGSIGPTSSGNSPAYFDEIIISNRSSLATLEHEVQNRWIAGSLLQLPVSSQQATVLSGDRIAEILCLAGFGTISAGAMVLDPDLFFINNSPTAWVKGTAGNGYLDVEPWYWDAPVINSSALDLILQICDTDIGLFFQKDDGTLAFYTQNYFGHWDSTLETWTPRAYTVPAAHVWTDDASSPYPYLGPSLQLPRDDADVWTAVKITPQAGIEQIYENVSAQAVYGKTMLEKSNTLHTDLASALQTATFLGHIYRSPLPRVDNVELVSHAKNGANIPSLFAKLAEYATLKNTPPGASTGGVYPDEVGQINQDFVVESVAHSFKADPGEWRASFVLDPYPLRT